MSTRLLEVAMVEKSSDRRKCRCRITLGILFFIDRVAMPPAGLANKILEVD